MYKILCCFSENIDSKNNFHTSNSFRHVGSSTSSPCSVKVVFPEVKEKQKNFFPSTEAVSKQRNGNVLAACFPKLTVLVNNRG